MNKKYKLFADDSGFKEFFGTYDLDAINNPTTKNRTFWEHNYFVFAGLIINIKDIPEINNIICNLKRDTFGTSSVELKSVWLRNPYEQNIHYLKKYGITKEKLSEFVDNIYGLFYEYKDNLKIISIVFDKRYYGNEKRKNNRFLPFINSFQVLLERLEMYMCSFNNGENLCKLVIDQMENVKDERKGKNKQLGDVLQVKVAGTVLYFKDFPHIEKPIEFTESVSENFIQLADLVAYNVYRQFIDYGLEWENPTFKSKPLPCYKYFDEISQCFVNKNGLVRCIGLCKIPDTAKINWSI